jgi:hypothetical protein
MQISPVCFSMSPAPVHTGNSLKSSSRIDSSVDGRGRPMLPSQGAPSGTAQAPGEVSVKSVGFGETTSRHLLPALGDRLLHGGAATDHHLEHRKIELVEARRVEQPIEQRVDAGHDRELPASRVP